MTDFAEEDSLTNLEEQGLSSFESDDHSENPPSDIVAFNELRSCADLFRLKKRGLLDLQPDFQRKFVWNGVAQTRFIDSLIKGLPIPSMCLAHDWKRDQYLVVDGLQRISTIVKFLDEDDDWQLARDEDIEQKIAGKKVADLRLETSPLRKFYDRLENMSIPVTIIRCDMNKAAHSEYVFTIFHRLNTGGVKLNNQEIRNCIFNGSFNDLLASLDQLQMWRNLNKMKDGSVYRYTKQELILRLFAFHEDLDKYGGRLSKFLNSYMKKNRNADAANLTQKRALFEQTVKLAFVKVFDGSPPDKINVSIFEAVLVGIASNLENVEQMSVLDCKRRYENLSLEEPFSAEKLKEGLSGKPRVNERMETSIRVFSANGN